MVRRRQTGSIVLAGLVTLAGLLPLLAMAQTQPLKGSVHLPPDEYGAGGVDCDWHMGACDMLHAYVRQGGSMSICRAILEKGVDLERQEQQLLKGSAQTYSINAKARQLEQQRDQVLQTLPPDCFAGGNRPNWPTGYAPPSGGYPAPLPAPLPPSNPPQPPVPSPNAQTGPPVGSTYPCAACGTGGAMGTCYRDSSTTFICQAVPEPKPIAGGTSETCNPARLEQELYSEWLAWCQKWKDLFKQKVFDPISATYTDSGYSFCYDVNFSILNDGRFAMKSSQTPSVETIPDVKMPPQGLATRFANDLMKYVKSLQGHVPPFPKGSKLSQANQGDTLLINKCKYTDRNY